MKSYRFKSLSSGSCGNCYFLGAFSESGECECGVLIDAGVGPRRLKKELAKDGLDMDCFCGILVTHDHLDHIRALGSYCKHVRRPVWTTRTLHNSLSRHMATRDHIGSYRKELKEGWNEIVEGRIRVRYFIVPHDARQTVGYAIMIDDYKFVIMTDLGRVTREAIELASQADTVVIESNYDEHMLLHGPYPPELQARIRGGQGHISNHECARAIEAFAHEGLRNVFLCHLSEHNNTAELAHGCSRKILPPQVRLAPLPRATASPLFEI